MELWNHVWHTVLMYFIVFVILRIMGKREIGKLSVFDLVISIMIAEIAVFAIEDTKKPLWESIVPMVVLVIVQITLAWVTLKNNRARTWFDGKPSIIIAQGHLNRDEMKRLRYNLNDLMQQLREQGVDNLDLIEYAIMESTGKLTLFMKDTNSPDSVNDNSGEQNTSGISGSLEMLDGKCSTASQSSSLNSAADQNSNGKGKRSSGSQPVIRNSKQVRFTELPLPLIMDGRVIDENLERINKTRFWLKGQIHQKGVRDFKEVFLCSIDHKGYIYVDKKDALK
ncbi:DUF421 domain-containing protein [Paenibacillus marinisediminis]